MAECIDLNCPAFTAQTLNDCGDIAIGGIDSVAIVKCGVTVVDPSDGVALAVQVAAGDIVVYNKLKSVLMQHPQLLSTQL